MCSPWRTSMVSGCAWFLQGSFSERGLGKLCIIKSHLIPVFSQEFHLISFFLARNSSLCAAKGREYTLSCLGCSLALIAGKLPVPFCAPAAVRLLEMNFCSRRCLYRNTLFFLLLTLGSWWKAWLDHTASLHMGVKWCPQGSGDTDFGFLQIFLPGRGRVAVTKPSLSSESGGSEPQERWSEHTEEMALMLLSWHRHLWEMEPSQPVE